MKNGCARVKVTRDAHERPPQPSVNATVLPAAIRSTRSSGVRPSTSRRLWRAKGAGNRSRRREKAAVMDSVEMLAVGVPNYELDNPFLRNAPGVIAPVLAEKKTAAGNSAGSIEKEHITVTFDCWNARRREPRAPLGARRANAAVGHSPVGWADDCISSTRPCRDPHPRENGAAITAARHFRTKRYAELPPSISRHRPAAASRLRQRYWGGRPLRENGRWPGAFIDDLSRETILDVFGRRSAVPLNLTLRAVVCVLFRL